MTADGWQVLVAFNNGALDDITAITSIASPGIPGGVPPTVGAHNVWTDVSQYVRMHSSNRGRQHELSHFEAGTCTIYCHNNTAVFNPWNTSSPFTGLLLPMKPIRIQRTYLGVTYIRYTGYVTSWPQEWADANRSGARIEASDAFRLMALANITSTQYLSTVMADVPDGYWRLGEILGTTAADSSGNGRNGTYSGGTRAVEGALISDTDDAFDCGQYAGKVRLPTSAGITGGGVGWTVEFWIKMNGQPGSGIAVGTGGFVYLAEVWNQFKNGSTNFLIIYMARGAGGVTAANCNINVSTNDGTNGVDIVTGDILPCFDNLWHHVMVTHTVGNTWSIYLDGVPQGITSTPHGSGQATLVTPDEAWICGPNTTLTSGQANCAIDEVAVYKSSALSTARALAHYQGGAGQWASQSSGARIGSVLDTIGWASAARSLSTGQSTLAGVIHNLTTTKSLSHMQTVEETEAGALYMGPDGKVVFLDRNTLMGGRTAVQLVLGDADGQQPYLALPDLGLDDLDIWNESVVTRDSGAPQTTLDTTSRDAYGRRTLNHSTLSSTDLESLYRSQYDVSRYKDPVQRVRRVSVSIVDTPATLPAVLGLDLLERVTFARASIPGGGSSYNQDALIEGIRETFDVESGKWILEFRLSTVEATVYWILGDATYGVLGSTTRLGF